MVHFLLPISLYTTHVSNTGSSAGIILSKMSACNPILTAPNLNVIGVVTVTTLAIKAPTTVSPIIDADSVKIEILSPREVMSFVPEK